jgi:hypothetical protein
MAVVDPNQRLRQISERAVNDMVATSGLIASSLLPSSLVKSAPSKEKKRKQQSKEQSLATGRDDGTKRDMAKATTDTGPTAPFVCTFRTGEQVRAQWKSESVADRRWYGATVVTRNADGSYHLAYDDGDAWEAVPVVKIKAAKAPKKEVKGGIAVKADATTKTPAKGASPRANRGSPGGKHSAAATIGGEAMGIRKKQKHASKEDKSQAKESPVAVETTREQVVTSGAAMNSPAALLVVVAQGMRVQKRFPGYGMWSGKVGGEIRESKGGTGSSCTAERQFKVTWDDGDVHSMTESEIRRCLI